MDIIPEMMVLVQAANESGWGTSRFSRMGLNLFGQWCYVRGCGLVPRAEEDGRHEVAKFDSVNDSVCYMRNINTHGAYLACVYYESKNVSRIRRLQRVTSL